MSVASMAEQTIETQVCVVGAGPVGGALACRLAADGIRTAVVDRGALPPMEHPDFDGRAYAIAAGSRRLLQAAGVWDRLAETPCPIRNIRVSDGRVGERASRLRLHFDYRDVAEPARVKDVAEPANPKDVAEPADTNAEDDGAFGWMVEARALRVALNRTLHEHPDLQLFAPAEATVTRDADGAVVRIAGGPTIRCRLVVAAEGRGSPLRTQAGIPVTRFGYRQAGIVCAIAHDRPHENTALEHFLPAGPFAQLPMTGQPGMPNVSTIVWTDQAGRAAELVKLDDDALAAAVARRLGDHLGGVRMVGRRWLYPLGALHAHRYVAERLALVGDAAHGIHPIAGQGLNLGFRDVGALAELVAEAIWSGGDPGGAALLARYQRARRPDNLLMLAATDALDRLFSNDSRVLRTVRDLGLAAVDRLPRLKQAFMRQAMGLP